MKKSAIILAGALAFDLGILVVGAQAAESPTTTQTGPATPGAVDAFLKLESSSKLKMDGPLSWKLDKVNTADACFQKMGKVLDTPQGKVCQLSKASGAK